MHIDLTLSLDFPNIHKQNEYIKYTISFLPDLIIGDTQIPLRAKNFKIRLPISAVSVSTAK